ncbi:hypothetical protein O9G_002253, partial [Rozella allomycis CSF55]
SSSGFREVAGHYGISKYSAVHYVHQVVNVLYKISNTIIKLPQTGTHWVSIAYGFEKIKSFPGVVGAIDGTLIPIDRPKDFEGWYCRKNFTALNMQGICDHERRFMAISIRSGSHNDQLLWNRSIFGDRANCIIPITIQHVTLIFVWPITLTLLSSLSGFREVAGHYGISKYSAVHYVNQVVSIAYGFEKIKSFPGVVGAIDGTLIPIDRSKDFEGWYFGKNFTALNMQGICDHERRLMAISIRSGSHNDQLLWNRSIFGGRANCIIPPGSHTDQLLWNRSIFGDRANCIIPPGFHILSDAGYALQPELLVPYPEIDCKVISLYNHYDTNTRIVIECAYEDFKNRWQKL